MIVFVLMIAKVAIIRRILQFGERFVKIWGRRCDLVIDFMAKVGSYITNGDNYT